MIRKATYHDMPELMEVFSRAREIMRASGNMNQWNDGYPSEDIVRKDSRLPILRHGSRHMSGPGPE